MKLNQVTVYVSDIERSTQFYCKLGLELIVSSPHYARFLCPVGDSTFSIHISEEVRPGQTTIYFECDDLDKRVEGLRRAGLKFESDPTDQPWLWREAYLADPDGHRICLFHAGKNRINPPWRLRK